MAGSCEMQEEEGPILSLLTLLLFKNGDYQLSLKEEWSLDRQWKHWMYLINIIKHWGGGYKLRSATRAPFAARTYSARARVSRVTQWQFYTPKYGGQNLRKCQN